jgi:hypothetical protein
MIRPHAAQASRPWAGCSPALAVGDEVMADLGDHPEVPPVVGREDGGSSEVSEGVNLRASSRAAVGQVMSPVARDDNTETGGRSCRPSGGELSRWHANSARPGSARSCGSSSGWRFAYGLVSPDRHLKPALRGRPRGRHPDPHRWSAKRNVPKDQLKPEPRDIITTARVNGSGVSEAEVTHQGNNNEIVVQCAALVDQEHWSRPWCGRAGLRFPARGAGAQKPRRHRRFPSPTPSPHGPKTLPAPNATKVGQAEGPVDGNNRHAGRLLGKYQARHQGGGHRTSRRSSAERRLPSPERARTYSTSAVNYTEANQEGVRRHALTRRTNPRPPVGGRVHNAATCP